MQVPITTETSAPLLTDDLLVIYVVEGSDWTIRFRVRAHRTGGIGMGFEPIASTSLQYVPVDVRAKQAGNVIDPTGDTVEMAFLADGGNDEDATWNAAVWETNANTNPDTYTALCLVGPGAVELTEGNYAVLVRVTDNPEIPVLKVSTLLTVT